VQGNLTVTAQFSPIPTYTISYAAGGRDVIGLPAGATLQVGAIYTVDAAVPTRAGYTFAGWSGDNGLGTLTAGDTFTVPAANVVLTAMWDNDSTMNIIEGEEEPGAAAGAGQTQSTNISGDGVPFAGKAGANWALLNLILALLGVALAVVAFVRSRRREDLRTGEELKARPLWIAVAIIAAVVSVVVFILTEDMGLKMAIVDRWTIVNAALFVVTAVGTALVSKRDTAAE
jgi:uncharacterized repeat protein (TIGR02543 family)